MLKAKRHAVLADISTRASGRKLYENVKFDGRTYVLASLQTTAQTWAENIALTRSQGGYVGYAIQNQRASIAAALVTVDGIPVEQVFAVPEATTDDEKAFREALLNDVKRLEDWRRQQVLDWFESDECDPVLTDALAAGWDALKRREAAAVKLISEGDKHPLVNSTPA